MPTSSCFSELIFLKQKLEYIESSDKVILITKIMMLIIVDKISRFINHSVVDRILRWPLRFLPPGEQAVYNLLPLNGRAVCDCDITPLSKFLINRL